MQQIYLDYNASTPIAPEVAALMGSLMNEAFGNHSSSHWAGEPGKKALEKARTQVAQLLDCTPEGIVFTSGGSKANNFALKGAFFASPISSPHPSNIRPSSHPADSWNDWGRRSPGCR